ncbi:MAG: ABC transporter substrate-binding protein [Pseudolabrys sp.]|nr:ABC transporter substrate-binding protein [Pseudolabrys sp.]
MSSRTTPSRRLRWLAACALLLCPSAEAAAVVVQDATGREVLVGDARRIVSIGGSVTEILYALGLADNVVGVDATSLYPPQALRVKANVGYMRQLSAEGVLGLRPSLILALAGSGPKETMAVLQAAQVPLLIIPDRHSAAGIVEKIRMIAQATGAQTRAQCLIDAIAADMAALERATVDIDRRKRVLFILSFVNGRAMAGGRNTAAEGIIRLAGGINAVDDYDGYKPLTDESVIAARPDVVLSMERAGPAAVNAAELFAHPAFAATPAAANRAFIAMEGLYLLGFGPRTARAARDLARALYPQFQREPLPSERGTIDSCSP